MKRILSLLLLLLTIPAVAQFVPAQNNYGNYNIYGGQWTKGKIYFDRFKHVINPNDTIFVFVKSDGELDTVNLSVIKTVVGGATASKWAYNGSTLHPLDTGKNVAIGTNDAKGNALRVDAGRVLFGNDTSGSGIKLMWIPEKAALRAGETSTNLWDDVNVGVGSCAFNTYTKASGNNSLSGGYYTTASNYATTSLGERTNATGYASTSTGYYTNATAAYSFSANTNTDASSYASSAFGIKNVKTGNDTMWVNSDPLFQIGNDTGNTSYNDAFRLNKDASGWLKKDLLTYPILKWNTDSAYVNIGGTLKINNSYSFPLSDGTSGQALVTDGSGNISFSDITVPSYWDSTGTGLIYLKTTSNKLAIGANSLAGTEKVRVYNGSVLFDGTVGSTPVSGAGTRFMWAGAKGAIRAGTVVAAEWDDANIGINSGSFGFNTYSTGNYSFSFGSSCSSLANYAFSAGQGVTASGIGSVGIGYDVTASGNYSSAFNYASVASGISSFSIGDSSIAIGKSSFAGGRGKAYGNYSFAFGDSTNVKGIYGVGLGYNNKTIGNYSVAIGASNSVTGSSNAIGHSNTISGDYSVVLGWANNVPITAAYVLGNNNINNGMYSYAVGYYNTTSESAVSIGYLNSTSAKYSTTLGIKCKTTGVRSVAIGDSSYALGASSFAANRGKSYGAFSVAIGDSCRTTSTAIYGISLGYRNVVSGSYAFAGGGYNTVSGTGATSFGGQNISSGVLSFSAGANDTSSSYSSTVFGLKSKASDTASFSSGKWVKTTGKYSAGFGYEVTITGTYGLAFGKSNTLSGLYSFVGNSSNICTHNNSAILGGTGITSVADSTLHTQNLYILGRIRSVTGEMTLDSLLTKSGKRDLADDNLLAAPTNIVGGGTIYVCSSTAVVAWAHFNYNSDGTVTLESNSANVVNTDTDTYFCIYDSGSGFSFKNRLGAKYTIKYTLIY